MVGDQTLAKGFEVYQLFRSIAAKHGRPIPKCDAVLDFGCGWGRVLRFFLKELPGDKLWGVDLWSDQIKWAKQTNPWCQFAVVDQNPPSDLSAESFDIVVAFSVFSHVSKEVHLGWLTSSTELEAWGFSDRHHMGQGAGREVRFDNAQAPTFL